MVVSLTSLHSSWVSLTANIVVYGGYFLNMGGGEEIQKSIPFFVKAI